MEKKQISLQVYSARNFKPYEDIFKFLSEEEMKNVELFEVEAFNEAKELLDKYNLTSLSSHIGFDTLKNADLILESLKKLNIVIPKAPDPVGAYVAYKIICITTMVSIVAIVILIVKKIVSLRFTNHTQCSNGDMVLRRG